MPVSSLIHHCIVSSFVWRGRASRREFWSFLLTVVLATNVLFALGTASGTIALNMFAGVVALATVPAQLAVTARRLHDSDWSGGWVAGSLASVCVFLVASLSMAFSPGGLSVGWSTFFAGLFTFVILALGVLLLVVCALRGTPGPNRYGPAPYGWQEPQPVSVQEEGADAEAQSRSG